MPAPKDLETEEDRENEKNVAQIFQEHMDFDSFRGTPKFYTYDTVFLKDDSVVAFTEIKCRNIKSTQYETTKLDLNKFRELKELAIIVHPRPVYLVIQWVDGVGYVDMHDAELTDVTLMNRKKVRWQGDLQTAAEISIDQFKFI